MHFSESLVYYLLLTGKPARIENVDLYRDMVELADTWGLKPQGRNTVWVRFPLPILRFKVVPLIN